MARMTKAAYQANVCKELGVPEETLYRMWCFTRAINDASARKDKQSVAFIWQIMKWEADDDIQFARLMVDVQDHPQRWVTIRRA